MTASTSSQTRVVAASSATLPTLVKLRFVAASAQLATIAVVRLWFSPHLAIGPMLAVVGVLVGSNFVLSSRSPSVANPKRWAFGTILLDVVILTVLLALSGGAHNPFTILYLVHVALTAMMLGPWELMLVLGTCVAPKVAPC